MVAVLAGVALAQMGGGPAGRGMGPGMMGGGMMEPGMMGGSAGQAGCAGQVAAGAQPVQLMEEKAKELAQQYADTYLKGFTVDKVLPFSGMHGTMYSVELKGAEGQVRTFHINPWGNVMPLGGPQRRSG
ncbi:MAG: hypothetical protein A2146_02850 [Actinobacteria bacterium RBG_16_67_10]|nr:MAG: hypothetical protein A2146_02850 [Actinobacteria bacterium RBG_16_67_10]